MSGDFGVSLIWFIACSCFIIASSAASLSTLAWLNNTVISEFIAFAMFIPICSMPLRMASSHLQASAACVLLESCSSFKILSSLLRVFHSFSRDFWSLSRASFIVKFRLLIAITILSMSLLFILSCGSGIHVACDFARHFAGAVEWDAFDVLDTVESESVGSSWAFSCPSGSFLELLGSSSNASWGLMCRHHFCDDMTAWAGLVRFRGGVLAPVPVQGHQGASPGSQRHRHLSMVTPFVCFS